MKRPKREHASKVEMAKRRARATIQRIDEHDDEEWERRYVERRLYAALRTLRHETLVTETPAELAESIGVRNKYVPKILALKTRILEERGIE